jgi:cytochrome c
VEVNAAKRRKEEDRSMVSALTLYARLLGLFAVLLAVVAFNVVVWGLHRYPTSPALYVPGGRPENGRVLIQEYGCNACHTVPGVRGVAGKVGPRLDRVREQVYIAGVLHNTPSNLILWIGHPKTANPRTAMPDLGVSEEDARDIAAYLYRLP